jgi:hypothetical protein
MPSGPQPQVFSQVLLQLAPQAPSAAAQKLLLKNCCSKKNYFYF